MTLDKPDKEVTRLQSKVQSRNLTSFKDFYREHTGKLVRFLICDGASVTDAAEIAQDVMTRLWESWTTVEYPKTWIRRVAERELVRRKAHAGERLVAEIPEESSILRDDVDIRAWEQRHDELKALDALPPRQRQILAWSLEGYTTVEIADLLQISASAVRANLLKARRSYAKNGNDISEEQ